MWYKKALFWFLVLSLVVMGGMLRFYHFPSNPPSLNWDEASIGYNAYSILKTGKDEYGKTFPLSFRSLDDYKLPLYIYATVFSEAVFGLNDFAVRFPSALAGLLTVVVLYFLVKELLSKSFVYDKAIAGKRELFWNKELGTNNIPLLSALILFILPWHVQFSRMAAEANIALFFFTSAIYAFVLSMKNKPWLLFLSFFLFGLTMYSYLGFRVIGALGLMLLCIYYRKNIFQFKTVNIFAIIFLVILFFAVARETFLQGGHIRFSGTSVFAQPGSYKHAQDEMFVDASKNINLIRRVFHDSPILTSVLLVSRGYLSHFSPDFLFFDQGQKHHFAPFVGLVYFWMLPFIILGAYSAFRNFRKLFWYMVMWNLISLVPPSVTWDVPHAIRSIGMVIPVSVFAAIGICWFINYIATFRMYWFLLIGSLLSMVILFFAFFYFHQYDIHLPVERSGEWMYGRQEMSQFLVDHEKDFDRIIVSTSLESPYIFFLYYSKLDPKLYLASGGTISGGWKEERNKFGKYEFHTFNFERDRNVNERILFIGKPIEFPGIDSQYSISPMHIVRLLDRSDELYFIPNYIK